MQISFQDEVRQLNDISKKMCYLCPSEDIDSGLAESKTRLIDMIIDYLRTLERD